VKPLIEGFFDTECYNSDGGVQKPYVVALRFAGEVDTVFFTKKDDDSLAGCPIN
jgi:hypothetical protein